MLYFSLWMGSIRFTRDILYIFPLQVADQTGLQRVMVSRDCSREKKIPMLSNLD